MPLVLPAASLSGVSQAVRNRELSKPRGWRMAFLQYLETPVSCTRLISPSTFTNGSHRSFSLALFPSLICCSWAQSAILDFLFFFLWFLQPVIFICEFSALGIPVPFFEDSVFCHQTLSLILSCSFASSLAPCCSLLPASQCFLWPLHGWVCFCLFHFVFTVCFLLPQGFDPVLSTK